MSVYPFRTLYSFLLLLLLLLAPLPALAINFQVSPPTARSLEQIGRTLENRTDQMKIRCSTTQTVELCKIDVRNDLTPRIQQELIGHPLYENQLIAYRAIQGTQEYRQGLYEALELQGSPTTEFAPNILERKLALENQKIQIRCTQNSAAPTTAYYQCWFIIHADLLMLDLAFKR